MSHLSLLNIQLQSFQYLHKSLKRLSQSFNSSDESESFEFDLLDFLQGKFATRVWSNVSLIVNRTETGYNLVLDKEMFAKNSISNVNILLQNITQVYAIETIIGETSEIGFEPLLYEQNLDGSKTIVLERVCESIN